MFGTIVVSPACTDGRHLHPGLGRPRGRRQPLGARRPGTIRGAGSTRIGWTGANMSLNSGIVWRWTNQAWSSRTPFTWLALKASTGNTPPAVNTPDGDQHHAGRPPRSAATSARPAARRSRSGASSTASARTRSSAAPAWPSSTRRTNDTTGPFTVNASGLTASRSTPTRPSPRNALGTSYTAAATFNTLNTAPTANAGGPYSVDRRQLADPHRRRAPTPTATR